MLSSSSSNRAAAVAGDDNNVKVVVIETRHVRTDAEHFKSVVQSLTGKDSTLDAVVPEKPSTVRSRWRRSPSVQQPPVHAVLVKPTAMAAAAQELGMWLHAVAGSNALEKLETLPHQTFLHSFGSMK